MNDETPYVGNCGARTRSGETCLRLPAPMRRRCNLHGGKSLRGHMHPRFKHGLYSQHAWLLIDREKARAELERRRGVRERRERRRGNYVNPRLAAWLERQKNPYTPRGIAAYLAEARRLEREYDAKLAARRERYRRKKGI